MANEHLGDRIERLRRLAGLTQEALAERSGVSVDVVRKLGQKRKHSARLPTLHALAKGIGVEVTSLLGYPPGISSNGEADSPALMAVRRAIMPPLFALPPEPNNAERLSLPLLRAEIADAWGAERGAHHRAQALDVCESSFVRHSRPGSAPAAALERGQVGVVGR
jgi:transcriptional regulator with XRE-family HTH domain